MLPAKTLPNAFEWLLGLYSDNYLRLKRLVDSRQLAPGRYLNEAAGQPALVLDLLEQQPYTTLMRLSLRFAESLPAEDPEAYWRVYHDAQQAEVTHCRFDEHRVRLYSPNTPARVLAQYRRRMNSFANKWLEHLLEGGYPPSNWTWSGPLPEWDRMLTLAPGMDADELAPRQKRAAVKA